jgi:hypothetical protein
VTQQDSEGSGFSARIMMIGEAPALRIAVPDEWGDGFEFGDFGVDIVDGDGQLLFTYIPQSGPADDGGHFFFLLRPQPALDACMTVWSHFRKAPTPNRNGGFPGFPDVLSVRIDLGSFVEDIDWICPLGVLRADAPQ